jgi:hypothetical protein
VKISPPQSNGGSYRVLGSGSIAKTFRRLYRQAKQQGREDAFMLAARQIGHRLRQAPFDFGEPLYRLPALRMQVRHGAVGSLLIYFAVHEDKPLVFIKAVSLLPEQAP